MKRNGINKIKARKKLGRNEKKELQFNLMHRDGILSGTERNAG